MCSPPLDKRFFISDLHIGHNKLAEIRGYRDFDCFWLDLKQAWNDTIQDHEVVYILGDVVMNKKHIPLLSELKGSKRIVLGNHDIFGKHLASLGRVKTYAMVTSPRHKVVLTHFPVHESYFTHNKLQWSNLHGHLHDIVLEDTKRYCNVCLEHTGLCPVPWDWVLEKLGRSTDL